MTETRRELERLAGEGKKSVPIARVLELLAGDERNVRVVKAKYDGSGLIPVDHLVGNAEAAALLGVDRTRISKWRHSDIQTRFGPDRVLFPSPVLSLTCGPLWDKADVLPLLPFVEERRRR